MYELTWDIPFLSYLTRNSPRSICYIRSLTETQSRSVTVACQTSNKTSTATTNPVYPLRSCRQDVATIYRSQTECTMSGNYLKESAVYQATVWTENHNPLQTYVGLTENSFKTRYSNHKPSFSNADKRHNTELSKYIWYLKQN